MASRRDWACSKMGEAGLFRYAHATVLTRTYLCAAALLSLACCGCDGGASLLLSLAAGSLIGGWWARHRRRQVALAAASPTMLALNPAQVLQAEEHLRRELALVQAGEAVSVEREWLARNQLGGLLLAQWRLEEARTVYLSGRVPKDPSLRSLTALGRHEVELLTHAPSAQSLEQIRIDRNHALALAPKEFHNDLRGAWSALEGLCLIRMGRAREGAALIGPSLPSMAMSPSRIIYHYHLGQAYEHLHEIPSAVEQYRRAIEAAPGTYLASEAQSRETMLSSAESGRNIGFRHAPPRLPTTSQGSFEDDLQEAEETDLELEKK